MATYAKDRRLFRAREGAYVGGVCAGLADYYECDAIVVRILAILLAILTVGVACIVYVVMWARLPLESESEAPYDVRPESAESNAFGCVDCDLCCGEKVVTIPVLARLAIAAGLMVLFLAVAMGVSPLVPGTQWWQFWPVALLMTGLCFIIIPIRTRREAAWHTAGIMVTALAASLLPMSLGIMSWATIVCAFENFWFLAILSIVLLVVGFYRENDALLLVAAFVFVAFCLMGITFCVIPGELESLFFYGPTGHHVRIAVVG